MSQIPAPLSSPSQARGAALAVSLILLVIITIVGLASIRGTSMQEHMSANMYDRELAFQAAETALRSAEALLAPGLAEPTFTDTCINGFCTEPNNAATWERIMNPTGAWWRTDNTALGNLVTDAGRPQFFIEDMGEWADPPECQQASPVPPDCFAHRYRISAQYNGNAAGRSNVLLQSNYRRQ